MLAIGKTRKVLENDKGNIETIKNIICIYVIQLIIAKTHNCKNEIKANEQCLGVEKYFACGVLG